MEDVLAGVGGGCFGCLVLLILCQATKTTFVDKIQHICCVLAGKLPVCIQHSFHSHRQSSSTLTPTTTTTTYRLSFVNDEVLWMVERFKESIKARLWQRVTICEITNDASLSVCACRPPSQSLCVRVCVYRCFACKVLIGINHVCSTTPSLYSTSFWHPRPNHRLMFCHQKVATHFRNALAECPPISTKLSLIPNTVRQCGSSQCECMPLHACVCVQ